MKKVYFYSTYWCVWNEILGYNERTKEITYKSVTPLNNDAVNDKSLGKVIKSEYLKLEMKFLSTSVIPRENKKFDQFCNEVFATSRSAFRILRFEMRIPDGRFDKTGCIPNKR